MLFGKKKGMELPLNLMWKIFWFFIILAAGMMIYFVVQGGSWGIIGQIFNIFANLPALILGT